MSINILIRNIGRFLILVVLQIFIFNNIHISSYGVVPVVYILYIILLPFETPKWLVMILAFFLGLTVDIFSDTMGINAAASVLVAFVRPGLLNYLSPRDGYEIGSFPRIYYQGLNWFLKYAVSLVFLHQIAYYLIESFGFDNFFILMYKITIAAIISLLFILLSQYTVFRK